MSIEYKGYSFTTETIKDMGKSIPFSKVIELIDNNQKYHYFCKDDYFYKVSILEHIVNIIKQPKILIQNRDRQSGKTTELKDRMRDMVDKHITICYITFDNNIANSNITTDDILVDKVIYGTVPSVINNIRRKEHKAIGIFIDEVFTINEEDEEEFFQFLNYLDIKEIPYFAYGLGTLEVKRKFKDYLS